MSVNPAPGLVAALLADDPVWSAYALADLQPKMAPYCRWYVHANDAAHAVVLIFDGLKPPILFAEGDAAALTAALSDVALSGAALPAQVYLNVREEHAAALARWYDHHDRRPMWRMVLGEARGELRGATYNEAVFNTEAQSRKEEEEENPSRSSLRASLHLRASASKSSLPLRRLTSADVGRVATLLQYGGTFTPDAFAEHQVELGVFYGVEDERGELAAVGGTHIVDYTARIAAVGNMYTRPDCRGQGYASAVLAAIVTALQDAGVATIVLNVDQRNTAARRIYERFGFVVHCPYIEGVATAVA
ncbi:GNAT family N-acetyltransferase [Caldilinea sp.]|uniref:GNAT family N-acetyltransferase n=1 Tax=Caldilinea sp. TaxID=2293560 RepID=UPI002D0B2263|nr:GNAT family N-acetyltransferase [Anaerolineales bacterium]HQY91417.1 GNAT family N-acetyltransferase [Caldilinea sp.]HRA65585.1 GNAT family N-acetyltransferase [Caldilinea sp.]